MANITTAELDECLKDAWPVEWSEMDREDLEEAIARELRKMEKEDASKE